MGEMAAQVRQGQATVFQVTYAWLLARLGEHPGGGNGLPTAKWTMWASQRLQAILVDCRCTDALAHAMICPNVGVHSGATGPSDLKLDPRGSSAPLSDVASTDARSFQR